MSESPTRLLFVCLGNICRSPTAEGVMRELVQREGLERDFEIDSAGTAGWHTGSPPDARSAAAAAARGIHLEGRSRRVRPEDFEHFDLILAMDRQNLSDLQALAGEADLAEKVHLLREFDPDSEPGPEVPDPYYGSEDSFDEVLDLVGRACEGLLEHVRAGKTA